MEKRSKEIISKKPIKNIGLFFGSFNPIHIGHLIIASYFADNTDLDQIWFVVSPQNPLKEKKTLLNNIHRLALVNIAIDDNNKFKSCDIEFQLPLPSYTINTLTVLKEKYENYRFNLIMGSDNLENFRKWKNNDIIIDNYPLYVYPRPGFDGGEFKLHPNVNWVEAPFLEISSSYIRGLIKEKKCFKYYLSEKVFKYINEMNFYKK